ncbi:MAG: 2-oxoacid:acceptor oxidoreductase family protein [Anaerolineaceae bacterium]|nr:2-oxoacid:acceptor oxidoreductase family protein [Anaerolineaceae bacterium]
MQHEIVISGFGGQGVMYAGQLLAYTAMEQNKQVTWIPSYGPEMRGGTANCTIIIADEEIGAPLVRNPQAVIALNRPSLDKYEPLVKSGGYLIVNSSMVDRDATREDIHITSLPGNNLAESAGNARSLNMVVLGALLAQLPILSLEALVESLKGHTPERNQHLIPANVAALKAGFEFKA